MTLKIISGDNPVTVSYCRVKLVLLTIKAILTALRSAMSELEALAGDTAIFGRVSPHQKKLLI